MRYQARHVRRGWLTVTMAQWYSAIVLMLLTIARTASGQS